METERGWCVGQAVSQTPGGTTSAPPSATGSGIQDSRHPPKSGAATTLLLCSPAALASGRSQRFTGARAQPMLMANNIGPWRPLGGHLQRGWPGWEEWTTWGRGGGGVNGKTLTPQGPEGIGDKMCVFICMSAGALGWVTHRSVTCRKSNTVP